MASLTRCTWVWVNSGSWWWTGRPGVLRFMGSQRVRHDWATELNWTEHLYVLCSSIVLFKLLFRISLYEFIIIYLFILPLTEIWFTFCLRLLYTNLLRTSLCKSFCEYLWIKIYVSLGYIWRNGRTRLNQLLFLKFPSS